MKKITALGLISALGTLAGSLLLRRPVRRRASAGTARGGVGPHRKSTRTNSNAGGGADAGRSWGLRRLRQEERRQRPKEERN